MLFIEERSYKNKSFYFTLIIMFALDLKTSSIFLEVPNLPVNNATFPPKGIFTFPSKAKGGGG